MANPLASIGNFFSDIGKGAQQMVSDVGGAISKGISNLTGGDNKPQSTPTPTPTPSPKPTPKPTPRPRPSPSPSPSSGGSSDSPSRSDSAGAKALNEQINSPTNSSTSTTGAGNPRIDSFVDSIKDNISDSSDTPKPTTTGAQSESSLPEPTISAVLPDTPIVGTPTIMAGDNKGQALTPDMITSNKPSGGTGSTSKTDNVVLGGITGVTDGVVNMGGLAGVNPLVDELNQPVPQTSVNTDAMVGLGGKPTLSLLPDDYNPLKVQSTISTLPDGSTWQINMGDDGKATIKNLDKTVGIGTDLIYRDPSLVGIHTFDSKAESEAFLKQLYPDGNFNWGDSDTKWYDPKTGEYIGYLGEEAYPYAVIVPETYDAPIRLEFGTGGQKGGSPVKDTGKSTWADVPSALTRMELRDAGFDYGFSSRNLDTQELMNQSEMRGYDSSWYDGMVGQNSIPYDAEKGGYDARTSNISVADVKSGKVSANVLGKTQGGKAILEADTRVIPTIDEKVSAYMAQEGIIKPAEPHIRAYYTIDDAVKRGVDKAGGYWYEDNPIISGIFGGLDTAAEGISQFSSDLKAGKLPVATFLLGATNPMISGGVALGNSVTGKDTINPMVAGTTWGLGVVEGLLRAPKSIASLDENVKAARSELGDEALIGLATPATLGMSNILANYYKDNPTDAFFDAATLITGGASIASRAASTASKLSKLDKPTYFADDTGIKGVQINDKIYGIDPKGSGTAKIVENGQITKEVRLPQTFIRDTKANIQDMVGRLKTRVEDRKVMRDLGDSSQRSSKYSTAYFDDSRSPTIDGDFTFKDDGFTASVVGEKINDKSNLNAFVTRDIDNLIRNDRAKANGITLFDDNRKGSSSLILRDRDSNLPILRDRDSTLPILRDKDSGNKALAIRDRDGALVTRSKIPYVPKDRNVPPVRRKKDNKILPFLDDLAGLLDGKDNGGLSGGMYGGRGRGRSWKVLNEDITDASQFTGLF